MSEDSSLMIVLTTGKQDRGTRATLAFSWGCAALSLGKKVSLYLTMDGTVWAMHGAMKGVEVNGFEPLKNYKDQFVEFGGEILVCAPCSEYYCSSDQKQLSESLIAEAKLVGLTTIAAKADTKTQIITF
ncbi:MAG: DsrE family protein [bacterium]